jgi:hypothetical protein
MARSASPAARLARSLVASSRSRRPGCARHSAPSRGASTHRATSPTVDKVTSPRASAWTSSTSRTPSAAATIGATAARKAWPRSVSSIGEERTTKGEPARASSRAR